MKKITLLVFFVLRSLLIFTQTTVMTTITYGGFQACGGCAVCGADYWCTNTPGSYCGNTPPCKDMTFVDPVPPGNLVTNETFAKLF